jgi:hypothetical protein
MVVPNQLNNNMFSLNEQLMLPIAKNKIINGGHCLAPEGTIIVVIIQPSAIMYFYSR